MANAVIYCRVSTEAQELEGTSLKTQLEACRKYVQDKGYAVHSSFSEAISGLLLDRPKLNELRELARAEVIEIVVIYSLDRLTRDPGHGVIITQEFEKHGVRLEAVTEDVDNTELGKLISYIRGFASKLEAEKIKERTGRGKRARAKEGRMPGGFQSTYGYDYVPVSQKNGGRRVVNEAEARWVNQMFYWLVNDGLTIGIIRNRLMEAGVPAKRGAFWSKNAIHGILTNPAYTGKTFAFTSNGKRDPRRKPQSEWVEIPGVTPAIINQELFDAARKQLMANRAASTRNTKREYLLRGHVKCRRCGRAYSGGTIQGRAGEYRRIYRCLGKWKDRVAGALCTNKAWLADKLEALVWSELERYLGDRGLMARQLDSARQEAGQLDGYTTELEHVERRLARLDREQHQLLQWALKEFPANQVETENRRLNREKTDLQARKTELMARIKASQTAAVTLPELELFMTTMQDRLGALDFEAKRLALDMLNVVVWIDGPSLEITGTIEPDTVVNASPPLRPRWPTWPL